MRVVICGYYGFGNLGDEAVLAAMLPPLRARMPTAEFNVLSANPQQTVRLHGVESTSRTGFGAVGAVNSAELFLSGGGSLIQDVTSAQSALYYLGTLGLATVRARRTMVFAQGVGPLRRPWIGALTRRILDRVDLLTVRDPDSRNLLHALGVRQAIHVVADPVFALEPAPAERAEALLSEFPRPRLGVALRSWGESAFLEPLIAALRTWRDFAGGSIVPIAFHPVRDLGVCQRVAAAFGRSVLTDLQPQEMMAVIGALDLLVAMRLHAMISAVAMGVPMIGLSYDPKVDALFRRVNVGHLFSVDNLEAQALRDALGVAWKTRDESRVKLLHHAAVLREDALRTADLAANLVTAPTSGTFAARWRSGLR